MALALGAHLGKDPADAATAGGLVEAARQRGADLAQVFLGEPQGWTAPQPTPEAEALVAAGIPVFVHAPYVINVATTNNRVRFPSRKLLAQSVAAAAALGAAGLVVHGGHVGAGVDLAEGIDNWRKTLERMDLPLPLLIENTAGGEGAMARRFDVLGRLWDAVAPAGGDNLGFCLDTCHAHAGGEQLLEAVDRIRALTGRIDLLHCNDSRDAFDSGADRHANLGAGRIDPAALLAVVTAAGAPVVVETPGGADGQGADLAWLRSHLPADLPPVDAGVEA